VGRFASARSSLVTQATELGKRRAMSVSSRKRPEGLRTYLRIAQYPLESNLGEPRHRLKKSRGSCESRGGQLGPDAVGRVSGPGRVESRGRNC
jgi:hypothetical protein